MLNQISIVEKDNLKSHMRSHSSDSKDNATDQFNSSNCVPDYFTAGNFIIILAATLYMEHAHILD